MEEKLLEKLRKGRETKDELAELSRWFDLNQSPELDEMLMRDWEASKSIPADDQLSRQIWDDILKSPNLTGPQTLWQIGRKNWLAILLGGAAIVFILSFFFGSDRMAVLRMVEKSNKSERVMDLSLEDGTRVLLNKGATLRYPAAFGSSRRDLWLEGEAYFEVAQDSDRPFRVISDNLETYALGTEFNVSAYREDRHITISLFSGKIAVAPTEKIKNQPSRWLLEPGDQMRFQKINKTPIVFKFDSTLTMAWQENRVAFDEEPMRGAFLKLERQFGKKIEYDPEKIEDCFANGNFKAEATLEHILRKILPTRKLKFKMEGDIVKISGKGCKSARR